MNPVLGWLGFASLADVTTAFHLGNVTLTNEE